MHWRAFVDTLSSPEASSSSLKAIASSKVPRTYVPSSRMAALPAVSPKIKHKATSSKSLAWNPLVSAAKTTTFPSSRESSTTSSADPFLVPAVPRPKRDRKREGKLLFEEPFNDQDRRKTFGGISAPALIPDIDLATRMERPRHRRIFSLAQPPFSTSSPNLQTSYSGSIPPRRVSAPVERRGVSLPASSSPFNMSVTDQVLSMQYGQKSIIKLISQNRGFSEDIVTRIWEHYRDFELTDAKLKRMWESAENTFYQSDDEVDEENIVLPSSPPRRVRNNTHQQFTPAPVADGDISDYSPPEITRAAQFKHSRLSGRSDLKNIGVPSTRNHSPESAWGNREHIKLDTTPPAPVWGPEEDKILVSGNATALKELETRMGRVLFKRRTAELMQGL